MFVLSVSDSEFVSVPMTEDVVGLKTLTLGKASWPHRDPWRRSSPQYTVHNALVDSYSAFSIDFLSEIQ